MGRGWHRKLALIRTMERRFFFRWIVTQIFVPEMHKFSCDFRTIMPRLFHRMATKIFGQEIANFGLKKKRFFGQYCSNFSANGDASFWRKEWLVILFLKNDANFMGTLVRFFRWWCSIFFGEWRKEYLPKNCLTFRAMVVRFLDVLSHFFNISKSYFSNF